MPTISMFRGIKVFLNWSEHNPPGFPYGNVVVHAVYGGQEVIVSIDEIEVLEGSLPSKQQKMLLGWIALHQEELRENWLLAQDGQELFPIDPLR